MRNCAVVVQLCAPRWPRSAACMSVPPPCDLIATASREARQLRRWAWQRDGQRPYHRATRWDPRASAGHIDQRKRAARMRSDARSDRTTAQADRRTGRVGTMTCRDRLDPVRLLALRGGWAEVEVVGAVVVRLGRPLRRPPENSPSASLSIRLACPHRKVQTLRTRGSAEVGRMCAQVTQQPARR
jgi:hypothetical protein